MFSDYGSILEREKYSLVPLKSIWCCRIAKLRNSSFLNIKARVFVISNSIIPGRTLFITWFNAVSSVL